MPQSWTSSGAEGKKRGGGSTWRICSEWEIGIHELYIREDCSEGLRARAGFQGNCDTVQWVEKGIITKWAAELFCDMRQGIPLSGDDIIKTRSMSVGTVSSVFARVFSLVLLVFEERHRVCAPSEGNCDDIFRGTLRVPNIASQNDVGTGDLEWASDIIACGTAIRARERARQQVYSPRQIACISRCWAPKMLTLRPNTISLFWCIVLSCFLAKEMETVRSVLNFCCPKTNWLGKK